MDKKLENEINALPSNAPAIKGLEDLHASINLIREMAEKAAAEKEAFGTVSGELKASIEAVNVRLDQFEATQKASRTPAEKARKSYGAEFDRWAAKAGNHDQAADFLMRHGELAANYNPEIKAAVSALAAQKAQLIGDDVQGGFLAPLQFTGEIFANIREFSPVASLVNVRAITGAGQTVVSKVERTAATWPGEAKPAAITGTGYASKDLRPYRLTAYGLMSLEALQDAAPLEQDMGMDVAEAFAIAISQAILKGTGNNQPTGILTNSDILSRAVNTGSATAITADGLIKAVYALKGGYARNATILLNRQTLREIRLLKDSQNRPLWDMAMGLGVAMAPRILELPYAEAVELDAPDISGAYVGNSLPYVIGDFSAGYRAVDRIGMSVIRDDVTLAQDGLVKFTFSRRFGGDLVQSEAFVVGKVSA